MIGILLISHHVNGSQALSKRIAIEREERVGLLIGREIWGTRAEESRLASPGLSAVAGPSA